MQSKQASNLKLLQWNAQGATTQSVITQIEIFLTKRNIDIATLATLFTEMTDLHMVEEF